MIKGIYVVRVLGGCTQEWAVAAFQSIPSESPSPLQTLCMDGFIKAGKVGITQVHLFPCRVRQGFAPVPSKQDSQSCSCKQWCIRVPTVRAAAAVKAEQQGQELREVLAGAEGFSRVHKAQRGIKARKVVQQALHLVRRIGSVLLPVLPPASFVDFGAVVIGATAERLAGGLKIWIVFSDSLEKTERKDFWRRCSK